MKPTKRFLLPVAALMTAMSLAVAACDEGPAEQVGERVDEAVDDAGDAMEEAGEEVERKTN
ncbi:MAG: hypothetical protein IH622_18465 [Ochrobactrum anthropi]|uniref:Entericidin EcnAB n=1 Tax=Brucella anthropi TaxID=529 RepID=A0A8I0N8P5_BRUAN|nr:hypothetical protein [Brucella anthropi]MBE0562779.1 hypothetical protein [Brucella anthropi]